jgi:hypothetical protein
MRMQRAVLSLTLALTGLGGCDVYQRWDGEFNAGPVDAQNFPPDYLGAGANRQRAGTGSFTGVRAFVGEQPVGYYSFAFQNGQLGAASPLAVRRNDKPVATAPTPNAYGFDDNCAAPKGWEYDARRDDVRYDEQGNIFTALPTTTYVPGATPTWTYIPVISHVPVATNGITCQGIKSEKTLVADKTVSLELTEPVLDKRFGVPDGTYRAWAIIEPGAAVYHYTSTTANRIPATGVGLQKWGWYNQYLLAYLDGGTIPTQEVPVNAETTEVHMVAQRLYYPRSQVRVSATSTVTVTVGQGYDVLEAGRGQPGYSPVCEVYSYDAGGPLTLAELPKSASEVTDRFGTTLQPLRRAIGTRNVPVYIYCLQLE